MGSEDHLWGGVGLWGRVMGSERALMGSGYGVMGSGYGVRRHLWGRVMGLWGRVMGSDGAYGVGLWGQDEVMGSGLCL